MHTAEAATQVPVLRFSEFEGEWEGKNFGKVYSFKSTNSYSRDLLNYDNGTIRNIHYGDIHTKFRTLFNVGKEIVPYLNEGILKQNFKEENYCEEGDLVIADASEDYSDIGKSIEIVSINGEKTIAGLHTLLARPEKGIVAIGFGGYLMKSESVRKQIMKIAQGTKVLGISAGRMGNILIYLPCLPEQQKIAAFLSAVDDRIRQLARKKTLLKQYKKGVMQQVFSQQVRFKDDDGNEYPEWEEKKLNAILAEHKTKNKRNEHPEVFSVAKEKGIINQIEHLGRSYASENTSNYKVVLPGDIVYTKSPTSDFPFGIIKQNKLGRTGIVSVLYAVFTPENVHLGVLLDYYFSSSLNTYNYLIPLVKKGAKNTMNISNTDFLNGASLWLPVSKAEQQKIAAFLTAIDTKIEAVSRQMEAAQAYKKGLLQQLFV